ncbi:MAG: hypothetical protein M3317_03380 [Actinomycetota bacterium]|nr:hypothetical protein [Actinomycetota bacterium]
MTEGPKEQDREVTGIAHRVTAWLACSVCALSVLLVALAVFLNWYMPVSGSLALRALQTVLDATLVLAFSTMGVLIVVRRPGNVIGWILTTAGLAIATAVLASGYVEFSLAEPEGRLPGTRWVTWVVSWIWLLGFGQALVFLPLMFPNGRLPSRRWRLVGYFAAVALVTTGFGMAFTPGPLEDYPQVNNPLGLGALEGSVLAGGGVGWLLLTAVVVLSAASMVVRYRRVGTEQRQQIKWFSFASALVAVGWIIQSILYTDEETPYLVAAQLLLFVALVGLPIAVGVAVMRYRLYEIDLLINRTLVYGALTAILAALYFGGIVVAQRVFVVLTGQRSTLAVVASTLLIAALFNPLRRYIQSFVARRFYRRKYGAVRTLEAFSSKLRDETDLDALSNDLIGVVRETMQPAHVSLWLRPDPSPRAGGRQEQV